MEKQFWNLIIKGYNRSEAEVKLKLTRKETNRYFRNAHKWIESLEIKSKSLKE